MSDEGGIDPHGRYSIGTAARLLGVSAATLRALEQQGQVECSWTPGGQRRFAGSELIRLRDESSGGSPRTPRRTSPHVTGTSEDAKARAAWLGLIVGRAQRELPADTPAEIRLRLGVDVESALRHFAPTSPQGDVEPLVTSLIERARRQTEKAEEDGVRREGKNALIADALAHLQQRIDRLPKRLVGPVRSLTRENTKVLLRARLRDQLQKRLRGDEDDDQVQGLADECLAGWILEQGPGSRVPNTLKLFAAGATGLVGGATAAAALSPAIRARARTFKGPLLSFASEILNRLSPPPPPTSSPPPAPSPPPPPAAEQAATTPPRFRPGVGLGTGWLRSDWQTRYVRATRTSSKAPPGNVTASDSQASDAPPTNRDAAPPESPGAASPSS